MISEVLGIATEDLGIDIGNGNGTEDLGTGTEDLGRCRGQEVSTYICEKRQDQDDNWLVKMRETR